MEKEKNEEIIVHVVCHTHDDPGWLWTFDDYYMGTDHCKVSVKKILDNMIVSLFNKKDRKFSYVEMCFFKRWYDSQTKEIKDKVKELLKEGRLEIINGGWVMHDEATVYYKHLLDNMRLGLKFLKEEFKITPKIGWFIDPFGHSSANAHLLSQMGYDKLVLTRINHQEREFRINNHNLEFMYNPFGSDKKIFTHISYHHYCPRKTLRRYPCDKKIELEKKELKEVCEKFYEDMVIEKKGYKHNNILLYYGDDFSFTEAEINYQNIEMIMDYVNNNMKGKMKMIYSTPSQYFDAVEKSGCKFDEYSNYDFFPYADNEHCYWTGYFSSRANLKGLVKQLGIYLNMTNRLLFELFSKGGNINYKNLIEQIIDSIYFSREKLGILQHHDAVTGTAKEKTNKDYENMAILSIEKLKKSIGLLLNLIGNVLSFDLLCGFEEQLCFDKEENNCLIINPHLNEDFLFNYRLKTYKNNDINSYEYQIKEGETIIPCNNITFSDEKIGLKYSSIQFNYKLNKSTLLTPITITKTKNIIEKKYFSKIKPEEAKIKINEETVFDCNTLKFTKGKIEFSLFHGYYTSYDGTNSKIRPENSNPDGAYIFAPCENEIQKYETIEKESSFYQINKNYTSIVLRYKNSYLITIVKNDTVDIYTESIFDPIPRYSNKGYNYLLVLDSNINNINKEYNQPEIFSDSQGINMLQRIKNIHQNYQYKVTEEVSSNFYPITSVVSMNDIENNEKINIFTDRAQSAGVINKGQIQLICQRFSILDDWKGVGEGLYENSSMDRFFSVKHFISFKDKNSDYYFNKVPLLSNIIEKGKKIESNLNNVFNLPDCVDLEFEIKKDKEIFVQIGNIFCDYYKNYSKESETISINLNKGKIIEYNLNGVDEGKEIENSKNISIEKEKFKLFLLKFNN